MPRPFQPLLLEDLEIRLPGMHLRRLALHRHMPRVEKVGRHRHSFHQLLLYLRGRGVQRVGAEAHPVQRGTLVPVRRGEAHSFVKERRVQPVCLVIDIEGGLGSGWHSPVEIRSDAMSRIEGDLHRLARLRKRRDRAPVATAAAVLDLLAVMEEAAAGRAAAGFRPHTERVRRRIAGGDLGELSPAVVAAGLGVSLDHLNRQLRAESGLTVGQLLAGARLERARHLLRHSELPVGAVAADVGYPDQNYFARWFRRQTGQSPSRWRG